MKIVGFEGGLGNQMFQYAFYKRLEYNSNLVKADLTMYDRLADHNGFELSTVFKINVNLASSFQLSLYTKNKKKYRVLRKLFSIREPYYEEEEQFKYNSTHFGGDSRYYKGYWQHCNYLQRIEKLLHKEFAFTPFKSLRNIDISQKMQGTESVAIHVRRGDYAKYPLLNGLADKEYFLKGISTIEEKLIDPTYYIFSDDIKWCRENLGVEKSTFVDWNLGVESYLDMQLMSCCKHAIISNSSFSWWAAWLNRSPSKIIVVPRVWYRSPYGTETFRMHPENWIKI
ncbi:alpha-1,2-fucosyltransferase [Olivibacter domesticus]|uniref:Glycosyl transferase family 11 n=1 Tax=Olivibacter domesticus TaxID=407022 RepID=A0A1H7YFB6_OLID1|nr:alpha-1,2-fucosyltransferase [Olivibacter domesticus]SEM44655.1 Glycosyl transferase family 11 [Olivibacter domesticus]